MAKGTERKKRVYQVKITVDGTVVFDSPVDVRRQSELNSVFSNYALDIGQVAEIRVERVF